MSGYESPDRFGNPRALAALHDCVMPRGGAAAAAAAARW